jgi:hypothetical protein
MVTRQVEQAKIAGIRFMMEFEGLNVDSRGLAIEANAINRHHHRTQNADYTQ